MYKPRFLRIFIPILLVFAIVPLCVVISHKRAILQRFYAGRLERAGVVFELERQPRNWLEAAIWGDHVYDRVVSIAVENPHLDIESLQSLSLFSGAARIEICGVDNADQVLASIQQPDGVEELVIYDGVLNGLDIDRICEFKNLRVLRIRSDLGIGTSLGGINSLKRLEIVSISGRNVTDQHLNRTSLAAER